MCIQKRCHNKPWIMWSLILICLVINAMWCLSHFNMLNDIIWASTANRRDIWSVVVRKWDHWVSLPICTIYLLQFNSNFIKYGLIIVFDKHHLHFHFIFSFSSLLNGIIRLASIHSSALHDLIISCHWRAHKLA